jgi:MYXO-CTERM domain-containing protein
MKRVLGMAAILLLCGSTGARAATTVDSHTLYFNNCQPNGCTIHVGATNALTDTSDLPSRTSTVTAFNQSATAWASVLSCARSVMAPFNLTITDQRPTSGDFFELIVAGSATDIGAPSNAGTTSDAPCTNIGVCNAYQPDAVVFAFANDFGNDPNQICSAALQAIAETWALDHVVDPSDVMTYNDFTGLRTFHDGEACGSDCENDLSPLGSNCEGSGATATHVCFGTGTATQDEVKTILALFGAAGNGGGAGASGVTGAGGAAGASGVTGAGGTAGSTGAGASGVAGAGGALADGGVAGVSGGGGAHPDGVAPTTTSGGGCGCAVQPTDRAPATLTLFAALLGLSRVRRRPRRQPRS